MQLSQISGHGGLAHAGVCWRDIEVVRPKGQRPTIQFHGQAAAIAAALLGALLLTWTEKIWPEVQEALIGVLFFLTVVVLMPFAVGPDLALLTRLGPAYLKLGQFLATRPDVVGGIGCWLSSFTLAATEVSERAELPWPLKSLEAPPMRSAPYRS